MKHEAHKNMTKNTRRTKHMNIMSKHTHDQHTIMSITTHETLDNHKQKHVNTFMSITYKTHQPHLSTALIFHQHHALSAFSSPTDSVRVLLRMAKQTNNQHAPQHHTLTFSPTRHQQRTTLTCVLCTRKTHA